MDRIITKRPKERERSNGDEQLPQLLDSPLPTPRRSCASVDASRCRPNASPLRTQVPFSWESSPGVPKNSACSRDDIRRKAQQEMPPPRLPPGRLPPCPARNWYYGNTSEASTDDDDDDRSFSDALDRISSPERIGSFDRVTSKRFEDIFVGRATSFAKDRSRHATADTAAISRHPKQVSRRRSARRCNDEETWTTPRQYNDTVPPVQLMQRIRMDARAEHMSPRACGLMVFFPWSAKPAVCGFRSPATTQPAATPRAGADAPSPFSHHSRRGTTLRDAIEKENEAGGGDLPLPLPLPQPRGEKRSRDERQGRRWGVSSLLDTSKKYCTDARKALSKLSIGLGTDGGSPRVGSGRMSGWQGGFSTMPATPAKLTHLKPNRN
ncbi:hypothetical protein ACP70R_036507 [Stipagrostis hirtigluma subsp. patula]